MAVFAHMIESRVDSFHVSVGSFHDPATMVRMFPGPFFPNGVNIPYAAAIKKQSVYLLQVSEDCRIG